VFSIVFVHAVVWPPCRRGGRLSALPVRRFPNGQKISHPLQWRRVTRSAAAPPLSRRLQPSAAAVTVEAAAAAAVAAAAGRAARGHCRLPYTLMARRGADAS